jgi:hypothetical protein
LGQSLGGLAHDLAVDVEDLGERAFRRQVLAGLVVTRQDLRGQLAEHLVRQGAGANDLQPHETDFPR